jgi:hypothetical protein
MAWRTENDHAQRPQAGAEGSLSFSITSFQARDQLFSRQVRPGAGPECTGEQHALVQREAPVLSGIPDDSITSHDICQYFSAECSKWFLIRRSYGDIVHLPLRAVSTGTIRISTIFPLKIAKYSHFQGYFAGNRIHFSICQKE